MCNHRTVLFFSLAALLQVSPRTFVCSATHPKTLAAGAVRVNPKDGAVMVFVPAGPFLIGDADLKDNPRRTVRVDGYWIYKTDVTVAEYREFCQATGKRMPQAPSWGVERRRPDGGCGLDRCESLLQVGRIGASDGSPVGESRARWKREEVSLGEQLGSG